MVAWWSTRSDRALSTRTCADERKRQRAVKQKQKESVIRVLRFNKFEMTPFARSSVRD